MSVPAQYGGNDGRLLTENGAFGFFCTFIANDARASGPTYVTFGNDHATPENAERKAVAEGVRLLRHEGDGDG